MKCLEFQFNPGADPNLVFDSFCHEAENIYERKMGAIYMLGELKRALPHNYRLQEKIAAVIKKEFYSKFQRTPESALKESLKRVNDLLSAEVSKENTDWLGNLNFAIISLKNFDLRFAKVGEIKIFLIRGPHLIDVGQKLDTQEIEPYPLKIFSNIVAGKLTEGDVIIAVTENIFPAFKDLINEIAKILPFDEKKIKDLIKTKETQLAESAGSFILINVAKGFAPLAKRPKIIFQKELEKFSLFKIFAPLLKYAKKIVRLRRKFSLPSLNISRIKTAASSIIDKFLKPKTQTPETNKEIPANTGPIRVKVKIESQSNTPAQKSVKDNFYIPKLKIPSFKIPTLKFPTIKLADFKKRKYIYIVLFLGILLIGFFLFRN